MSIERVEVHEVGEDQSPPQLLPELRRRLARGRNRTFESLKIVPSRKRARDAAIQKNVRNLAHPDDVELGVMQQIEQHGTRRLHGIVVAALGSPESAGLAREGSRNHAPHAMLALQ